MSCRAPAKKKEKKERKKAVLENTHLPWVFFGICTNYRQTQNVNKLSVYLLLFFSAESSREPSLQLSLGENSLGALPEYGEKS